METSVEIKVLIIIAGGFILSAFAVHWVSGNKGAQLIGWIKQTFPDHWNGLPKVQRNWLRTGAIEYLRRHALKDNDEFARRYSEIKRLQKWQIWLLAAGAVPIGAVIIGTRFGIWSW